MGFLEKLGLKRSSATAAPATPAAPAAPAQAKQPVAPAPQKPAAAPVQQKPAVPAKPAAAPVPAKAAPAPVPPKPAAPPVPAKPVAAPAPVKPAAAPVQAKQAPAPAKPAPAPAPAPPRPAPAAPARTAGSSFPFLSSGKAPTGPLDLAKGDSLTHYRERFTVVGVRQLDGEGGPVLHYVLKDAKGGAAVLVCESAGEAALSLQRAVKADLKWDVDVINGVGDEPVRLVKKGQMKVRTWDDAGVATGAKTMEYRRFADASGDRVVSLEDYASRREVRVGEPVFEGEIEIERGSGAKPAGAMSAAMSRAKAFEDAAEGEIVKGTPLAAAKALEQNMGSAKLPGKAATPDHDPTRYDDDAWVDAQDDQPAKPRLAKAAAERRDESADDEDEWVSASQLVRGEGASDDDDPGLTE